MQGCGAAARPRRSRRFRGVRHPGPDCLGADGMLPARIKVVTGHIGFQPSLLARFRAPFTAVVFPLVNERGSSYR